MVNIFERKEIKYVLTEEQFKAVFNSLSGFLKIDSYGWQTINNLYFDNDDNDVIRTSLSKPAFKEKMRLRSYGEYTPDQEVYLELKKKFNGTVFKRRIQGKLDQIENMIEEKGKGANDLSAKEIFFFMNTFNLYPKIFIAYDRLAMYCPSDKAIRITFDKNIRYRTENLKLDSSENAILFSKNEYVMEIKGVNALPLWLTGLLAAFNLVPSTYSKYGKIYEKLLLKEAS